MANFCLKCCANPSSRCWDIWQDKWQFLPAGSATGKSQRNIKVTSFHPLGTMEICTKCHGNPYNCCWDILYSHEHIFIPTRHIPRQRNVAQCLQKMSSPKGALELFPRDINIKGWCCRWPMRPKICVCVYLSEPSHAFNISNQWFLSFLMFFLLPIIFWNIRR